MEYEALNPKFGNNIENLRLKCSKPPLIPSLSPEGRGEG
jgi:hypothetical protein